MKKSFWKKSLMKISALGVLLGSVISFVPGVKAASNVTEAAPTKIEVLQNESLVIPQQPKSVQNGLSSTLNPPEIIPQEEPVLRGVKSKAVAKIANALLDGADGLVDALKYMNVIDDSVARVIKNNSGKLGKKINSFANYGEDAANAVRTQLPGWILKNTGVTSKGTAENIAIALSYAIRAADWLI